MSNENEQEYVAPPRGCGKRIKGGLYLCTETSPFGTPVWDFLQDPPRPYTWGKFQGVKIAPDDMMVGWGDDKILLLDMVGMEFYPTVAEFVEETRRMGLSRRIPATFDFSKLAGKQVYLGLIHWRAIPRWKHQPLAALDFKFCQHRDHEMGGVDIGHYPECVYHSWVLSPRHHDLVLGLVPTAWGDFDPTNVIAGEDRDVVRELMLGAPEVEGYEPGLFGVFPIHSIDAVGYIPDSTNVQEGRIPVGVTNE